MIQFLYLAHLNFLLTNSITSMTKLLEAIVRIADAINEQVGKAVAWLTSVLVVIICFDVLIRYFFKASKVWMVELEWHFFALVFLLGAGYALKHDRHVRVDLFYTKFSEKGKAWVNLIGTLIFLIPWCVIILGSAYQFAHRSWLLGESSPNPNGLPALYVIKFAIVIGFVFLLLQGIALVAQSLLTITKPKSEIIQTKFES